MMFLSTSKYTGYLISVELVGWGICIGALIALSYYFFDQKIVGSIVRNLLTGSTSPETAASLSEINKAKPIYKFALSTFLTAKKAITTIDNESYDKKSKQYLYNVKLFVSETNNEFAHKRYEKEPKVWVFIISILVIIVLGVLMQIFLPMGLEYLENY